MAVTLKVEGMSCGNCEKAVKGAVNSLEGIKDVQVDLSGKTVQVDFDESTLSVEEISEAIEDQGYDVVE